MATTSTPSLTDPFPALRQAVQQRFTTCMQTPQALLWSHVSGLWETFLRQLPADIRQSYTCHACRRFVEQYGSIVTVTDDGTPVSPLWDIQDVPEVFHPALHEMAARLRSALVSGVFLTAQPTWGTPQTPPDRHGHCWEHLTVTPPPALLWQSSVQTPAQAMAEKHQEYGMLARSLADYPLPVAKRAAHLLHTGQLARSEKALSIAEWFVQVHTTQAAMHHKQHRENLLWRTVALAPPGFCHLRAGMLGTLCDDLQEGKPFAEVKRAWDAKMHPLLYQRPQAPPTAGTIAQAEKLVEQLGVALSLERRFATKADILEWLWQPRPPALPARSGVFGHLRPPAITETYQAGMQTMTWQKFAREVLPYAETIAYHVPRDRALYSALVTAVHAEAPLMFQWENPVSWYMYHSGSLPGQWNLHPDTWVTVEGITQPPWAWNVAQPPAHHHRFALLLLGGCRDTQNKDSALFPETLRSAYHGIRSVMEAYSQSRPLAGGEAADACGINISSESPANCRLRVRSRGIQTEYVIDRWD